MTGSDEAFGRRDALRLAGGAVSVSVAGLAGCTGNDGGGGGSDNGSGGGTTTANETTQTETTRTPSETTTPGGGGGGTRTIELGGKVAGWMGRRPARIEGKTNPTLRLEPGTTYELVWVNLDGKEHELIIEDANGNEIAASESAAKKGKSVTMRFTANRKMAQYYCEYHPQSMRGDVATGGSSN